MSAARSPSGRGRPRHEIPLSPALILAALLGIVIIATLWWAYFQVLMPAGEQALRRLSGPARVALARDAYSLLHLPILAGIVLFALGLEKELSDAKHSGGNGKAAPLDHVSLGALYGGVILYLLGVLAFQRRVMGRVSRLRVAATALLGALAPIGALVPALAALGMLAVVAAGLVAVEFAPHTALHRQLRDSLAADEH